MTTDETTLRSIAKRSRATPRTANYLLKRCRDMAQVENNTLNNELAEKTFNLLEVDERGLHASDRVLLRAVIEKFNGGPVGLNTLAAATGEEMATIEDVLEPYLIRQGLIERTPRGRVATSGAYDLFQ